MIGRARRWLLAWAAVIVVVGGLLAWWVWSSSAPAAPRARQYRDVDACLLTDMRGLAEPRAASVWTGMQDASAVTRARVSYLAAQGEDTVANVLPYLASLLQRSCDVVVAVGPAETAAVAADAAKYPKVRFVVVGGSATGSNVSRVETSDLGEVRGQVKQTVVAAIGR